MPEREYNATVVQGVEIAPRLIILRVLPDDRVFSFEAGQYTVLGLRRSAPRYEGADPEDNDVPDRMIRKPYSIGSSSRAQRF